MLGNRKMRDESLPNNFSEKLEESLVKTFVSGRN